MTHPTLDPAHDYPLGVNRSELLYTSTGKNIVELTMANVMGGAIMPEDLRIAPETLRLQAQIAERVGRPQLGVNLRRAAEMTAISDARVLEIYNALRPRAATKQELLGIADELEFTYAATMLSSLVREAAEVYEDRDLLAVPE